MYTNFIDFRHAVIISEQQGQTCIGRIQFWKQPSSIQVNRLTHQFPWLNWIGIQGDPGTDYKQFISVHNDVSESDKFICGVLSERGKYRRTPSVNPPPPSINAVNQNIIIEHMKETEVSLEDLELQYIETGSLDLAAEVSPVRKLLRRKDHLVMLRELKALSQQWFDQSAYPYQQQLRQLLNGPIDDRTIIWVHDGGVGNVGKSKFKDMYQDLHRLSCVTTHSDIQGWNLTKACTFAGSYFRVLIVDCPRAGEEPDYGGLELIKSGNFISSKQQVEPVILGRPVQILCLANKEPIYGKLSMDRWLLGEINPNKQITWYRVKLVSGKVEKVQQHTWNMFLSGERSSVISSSAPQSALSNLAHHLNKTPNRVVPTPGPSHIQIPGENPYNFK